jgi:ribulose-phosphate 3-epimerase
VARAKFWNRVGGQAALAPSLLSADFGRLAEAIASIETEADALHIDVMDGHFVPNITFGPPIVRSIRAHTDRFLDCHLMVEEPLRYVEPFIDAGADLVTIHAELFHDPTPALSRIRSLGALAGLALNPDTPVDRAAGALGACDLLLVMSVFPGFGGQELRREVFDTIREAARLRSERGHAFAIEVDGGVSAENAGDLVSAGVDVLVAGSAIFSTADPADAARRIRAAAARR